MWLTHNSCYLDAAFKRGVMRALDVQLWCYSTAVSCTVHSHLTRVLVKEKRKIENTHANAGHRYCGICYRLWPKTPVHQRESSSKSASALPSPSCCSSAPSSVDMSCAAASASDHCRLAVCTALCREFCSALRWRSCERMSTQMASWARSPPHTDW